jgi:hypothetical protein
MTIKLAGKQPVGATTQHCSKTSGYTQIDKGGLIKLQIIKKEWLKLCNNYKKSLPRYLSRWGESKLKEHEVLKYLGHSKY